MHKFRLYILFLFLGLFSACGKYGYDFEDGYTKGDEEGNTETPNGKIDKSQFAKAAIFPGLVGEKVRRIADTSVSLIFNTVEVSPSKAYVRYFPEAILSTGLYAPAGEPIKITVPSGVNGLFAQVGSHATALPASEANRREQSISQTVALLPGDNYVRNPFGGTILIKSNVVQKQNGGKVDLKVSGAVKSNDFVLGVSNLSTWLSELENNDVPWLELRGKYVAFSVSRARLLKFKSQLDPEFTLKFWDDILEKDVYALLGLENKNLADGNSIPFYQNRIVLDIQPLHGAGTEGLPIVIQDDDDMVQLLASRSYVLANMGKGSLWNIMHFIGHNYQQNRGWEWVDLNETSPLFFIYKTANRLANEGIANQEISNTALQKAYDYVNMLVKKRFDDIGKYAFPTEYGIFRMAPFLQMIEKIKGGDNTIYKGKTGWDFLNILYYRGRNNDLNLDIVQNKKDFFYRTLCEFTGKDYNRFLMEWGIIPSTSVYREMRMKFPPMDKDIWTYNSITKVGGTTTLPLKYDVNNVGYAYKSTWTISTSFTTANLSDRDYTTYCSLAKGTSTELASLSIDFGFVQGISGFYYGNNAATTSVKDIEVYVSNDNETWVLLQSFNNIAVPIRSRIEFPFTAAKDTKAVDTRYLKLVFPTSGTTVALSELGFYFDGK